MDTNKPPFNLKDDALFIGISGIRMPFPIYELSQGIILRETYVHVAMPSLLAFGRPASPHLPHPAPWSALTGRGLDVITELEIGDVAAIPFGFDRINLAWLIAILIQLHASNRVFSVFVSDRNLHKIKGNNSAHTLPFELGYAYQLAGETSEVSRSALEWVEKNYRNAAELMPDSNFNDALQTVRGAWLLPKRSASVVTFWASLETLFRPGRKNITDRIAKLIATYLAPIGPDRDRLFYQIKTSYSLRGNVVHAGASPEHGEFDFLEKLTKRVFARVIEEKKMPDPEYLVSNWKKCS